MNKIPASPFMTVMRRHNKVLGSMICAITAMWQVAQPLQGADIFWTAGSSTDFQWDNAANWGGAAPTLADDAILPFLVPNPGTLENPHIVILGAGSTANSVRFRNNYLLAGGTLTLDAGGLFADLGTQSTISSVIAGASGLLKSGGGTIRLENTDNTYTGATTIANGTLIIGSENALGSGPISILTNNNTPLNANLIGFTGGSLVLDGVSGAFNTFSRDIDFEGRGPIGDRGSAIQTLGDFTLSGTLRSAISPLPLSPTASFRNSRINSVNGTLNITGTLNAGGTSTTTITSLGGVNTAGVGNFSLTGVLAGTGTVEKSGSGTLFLNPSSVTGFSGTVRVSGSSTGQQSTVRVTQLSVGGTSIFGANTGTNASSVIDMNGGVLEFRNEGNLDFNALTTGKNVYLRANSSFYTGPGEGGQGVNGLTTLGTLRVAANTTGTFNSRNGYGMTLGAWTQESSNNNNTITNNMGGDLTFTAGVWGNNDSGARTLSIGGNGNTVIKGSITATAANHILTKSGSGRLVIEGTGGTYLGATNITGGAIQITDFRSINNNTAAISLGNATTTAGHLIIGGVGTPTAAGLTTSKTITFNTTTASNSLYANQTGTNPVILNGAITKRTDTSTGNLILGGTNAADNIINVVVPAGTGTGGLTKLGAGTWVLNAANTYTGATTIQNGTLKLRATAATTSDVIPQAAGNTIVFGANSTTGTAGGALEFRGHSSGVTTETLGALTPTAGAGTVRLLNNGFATNLTFTSLGTTTAASSVNFVTTGAPGGVITLTGQAATTATNLPGTANFLGRLYLNGSNFATINSSAQVVAPSYTNTPGDPFRQASSALVASVHNQLTGSFTSSAATVSSLLTNNQTLTLSGNLTVSTGGILQSGGTASIVSDGSTSRLILGGAAATNIAVRVNGASDVLNFGTASNPVNIGSAQTGGLTKNGAGRLVIFGTNAQTGALTINEGTLELNGTNARMAAPAGVATVLRQNSFIEFNSGTPFASDPTVATLDGAGTIRNVGAANVTLVQTGAGTFAGSFNQSVGSGVLNISKLGTTGAPTWSGMSNYTGVTTIGGTTGSVTIDFLANIGQDSGIGRGNATDDATNAASLVFAATDAAAPGGLTFRGSILDGELTLGSRSASTNRLFTITGTGVTLTSNASNNNAMVWSNTGAIVHGGTDQNRVFIFAGTSTGDNTFNPQITNATGFVTSVSKTGASQWNLGNSNNTYTGTTSVADGILALNQAGALPSGSPLVLGATTTSGILQASGSFARDLAVTPAAGTGTITWGGTTGGGGFAANTTALSVTLNSGAALTWGSGGFVPTGAPLIFGSASALSDVTFTNAIDLGTAVRTITVNDNGNTGADYATMTGNLSGEGGGLNKLGAGVLRLTGASTYSGTTTVTQGTLVVSSLGNSANPGVATSVGTSTGANLAAGGIVLSRTGDSAGILQYVGPGETSNRFIQLGVDGGNGSSQIHADGLGALILTNVNNTANTAVKTLFLRGTNASGNMITNQLSDNTGALSITVDGGATWILTNGSNNYTGTTTASGGALGIGHNTAIPAALTISNGNVFAFGGDRVLTNTLNLGNNATSGFIGDYSVTFNGTNNLAAGANNLNLYNSIAAGKVLTLNGLVANALTGTRALAVDGPGETIINNNFTTGTGYGVNINKTGNGILTLGTNGASSNWNQAGNNIDVDRGVLKFANNEAIPTAFGASTATTSAGVAIGATTYTVPSTAGLVVGQTFTGTNVPAGSRILSIDSPTTFTTTTAPTAAVASGVSLTFVASGGLILSPEVATLDTSTLDLNGTTQSVNALSATTDGTVIIDNTAATAATFRFGANNSAVAFGSGAGTYTIQNTGDGALSLVKLGNTAATFNSAVTVGNKGSLASEGGGSFVIAGPVTAATGLRAIEGSTLALTGGITNPGLITSINVGAGSTLSLLDGAGSSISNLNSLSLGNSGTGTVTLNLNVGDISLNETEPDVFVGDGLQTDTLRLLTGGTLNLGNTITFNMTDAGLNPNQTYTLLNLVDGGLTAFGSANLIQGATPGGFTSMTWTITDNRVQLTTGGLIVGDVFWRGATNSTWNGNANNWSTDKAGTIAATSIPGQGNTVRFAYDGVGTGALTTTLEQNFKVNALVFEPGVTTPASVTINPGSVATARLEVNPQSSADGIAIPTGGPAAVTIASNFRLGANQTWNVTDTATLLTLSGSLFGEKNVTKSGAGRVVLSGVADSSFNAGKTAVFTVAGGNLELTNVGALGTLANDNRAGIVASGGGFYLNNATASTFTNALTLSGGALSAGGNTQTYSSTVNVTAASTINMADSNGPVTNTARSITLSGGLTGSGNLTVTGNNTASGGNQIGGTLTLNQDNSTWSGNWNLLRGSIATNNVNGLGSGAALAAEKGRIQFTGTAGARSMAHTITVASSTENAILELNQAAGIAYTYSGLVTLGGTGGSGELRVFMSDDAATATLTGGVVLANNGGLSTQNAATRVLMVDSVISETGGARTLTINDSAWGGTGGTVRLNMANTYTGGTVLSRGILQVGNLGSLSTGAITAQGASTLNSLVDFTGVNALANTLNLNAVLTFTGSNGFTFNSTTSNIGAGGITNSLTSGSLLFSQVNLSDGLATAARTLTLAGASTGGTAITALLNNRFNNTLTNNITAASHTLMIGSIALSEDAATGRTLTLGGSGNTTVTGVIENIAGGGGLDGSLVKADAGVLTLEGANTFTGPVSISAGVLQFSTATNAGAGASNLGNGASISMAGGNLRFIGSTSQSTNRPVAVTAAATLSAHGTGGASITYSGAINTAGNTLSLAGADSSSAGFITGGITQTGTTADISVNSGNWTMSGAPSVLADDIIVTNASAVLNLNGASLISFTAGTSNGLYARSGAVINLLSNDIFGPLNSGGLDFILLGDNSTGGGTLNVNNFSIETPRLDLGQRNLGFTAQIDGTGTVFVRGGGIDLFDGTVNANLASDGTASLEKIGIGTVTLKGDNSGLASTGSTIVYEGTLILDYTANNATKLRAASALDMRGADLILNGSNSSPTSQSVASYTLGSGGANVITLNPGVGQGLVLNLNAITRAINGLDGTVRFNLPSGIQSATNGITTDTLNTIGTGANAILGGWATVNDGTGVFFARNVPNTADGNIGAAVTTLQDNVASWLPGENISDATGFTGAVSNAYINSLRFNAASGSDLAISSTNLFGIASGGILVTSNVGGTPSIMNGTIFSGAQASNVPELMIIHDGSTVFELGADLRTNSAFTKSGPGTVRLSGRNTYTGTTAVENGILQLSGGNAVGDTSVLNLGVRRQNTVQLLANETIGGLAGGQRNTEQDFGIMDLGLHTLTINQAASTAFAGRFAGTGTIVMATGNGNFNYSGMSNNGAFTGSVVVNSGLFQISGDSGRLNSATAFTINGAGSFLLDNNADNNTTDRISDTATFVLNSAAGFFSTETRPRGLSIRNNDNDDSFEVIGSTIFNSGASYLSLEASGGTSAQARIVSSGWTRSNSATLNVRGRNLGGTANERSQFKVQDANDAAMLAANVGGGGAIGGTAKNVSIIPWAIGETLTAALADGNMGNTFLSYVDNRGFVPLSLASEFSTFAAAASGDNVRESLGADLTGLNGATINSLILNNTAVAGLDVTGNGVGQTLAITSGAMLFTVTGGADNTAYDTTLGGFDGGITVGGTNEYVISVVNPSSAAATSTLTATLASPLTSSADITKSGRGTLILTQSNTAGGGARRTTLNEGVLQIADLDNIGGNTGALVFAGGTLRLGAGFADDLSTRTISFLQGGGTLDTNGIDLALAGSLGSGVGGFTKAGAGNLTLNAVSTFTGGTTVSGGTLTVGVNNALGSGSSLTVGGAATLDIGTRSISHTLVTTSGAVPVIAGTGTITATTGFFFNHTGDTSIGAVLAGAAGLLKTQANVVTLTGANTYTGNTEIQAGTLSISSLGNVGSGAGPLGAPTTVQAGIIRMGFATTTGTLQYTGAGHSSNRLISLQGTSGGATINANGTGALALTGGARTENAGAKVLTLGGTSDAAIINTIGLVQEVGPGLGIVKSGTNTWSLSAANIYTGTTSVDEGILRLAVAQNLAGALQLGSANSITTAGKLEVIASSQFGSLLAQTNSASNASVIDVPSSQTLTINGAVTLGSAATNSTTLINATGAGSLVVNNTTNTGNTFLVGGTGPTNQTVADFAGLASLNVSLNTTGGTMLVSSTSGTNSTGFAELRLASSTTITANALTVGGGGTFNGNVGQVNQVKLGSGSNILNVNSLNIGTGARDLGSITFQGASGTVTVRAADGTSAVAFNMGTGSANTAVAANGNRNTFDVSGHDANLLFGAFNIGTQAARTGALENRFSFDTGILVSGNLNMGSKTAAGDSTNVINLGGGLVTIGSGTGTAATLASNTSTGVVSSTVNISGGTVTIGSGTGQALILGNSNTNATGSTSASLNITGGNVTLATTGTTAATLANASAGTATAAITISGGSLTVQGDILRGTGAGIRNATVTLSGGSLNMGGRSIGASGNAVAFVAQSGTLTNLAQLNAGGALTKTTAGVLIMGNGNAYTGGTSVTEGTLRLANTAGSATGSGALSTSTGTTLTGVGSIVASTDNNITVGGSLVLGNAGDTGGSQISVTTAGTGAMTLNGDIFFDLFGGYDSGVLNTDSTANDRLVLTGANGFTIGTGSNLFITSSVMPDSSWVAGTSWRLFDWSALTGSVAGSFANLPTNNGNFVNLPNLESFNLSWDVSQLYTLGTITIVPEPSRAMLLMLGLMLGLMRRRRRGL